MKLRREPLEDAEEHTRVLDASTRAAFPRQQYRRGHPGDPPRALPAAPNRCRMCRMTIWTRTRKMTATAWPKR